ncbi:hypothetical protein T265_09390 [Opisthorchis viverrini]|uniref:Uncharacterized protein n=1 Tax=Opisthorchis viverrini TaxID=6198 RepID=A0A074ZH61_OPIVI|nr:hypothetical protein T265_09390 [Opisthorchis viverrini]KER22560.1 hypothetical protein T265_09390 [Opisthorchis viverrini]
MKSNIVVANDIFHYSLGTVVLKYVIIALEMREEVDIANPGALVENITQDKHQIRLEKGKRSLERLSYLPISVQEKDGEVRGGNISCLKVL